MPISVKVKKFGLYLVIVTQQLKCSVVRCIFRNAAVEAGVQECSDDQKGEQGKYCLGGYRKMSG